MFGQLHVSAALLPEKTLNKSLYESSRRGCGLYFWSVSTFCHVFCCQLKCWVCWQNLSGFRNIHSGRKQWKAIQLIPKLLPFQRQAFPCRLITSRLVVQREDMIVHIEGPKSRFAPTRHSTGISLCLNCLVVFQKDLTCIVRASVQTRGWPFLTFV